MTREDNFRSQFRNFLAILDRIFVNYLKIEHSNDVPERRTIDALLLFVSIVFFFVAKQTPIVWENKRTSCRLAAELHSWGHEAGRMGPKSSHNSSSPTPGVPSFCF